MWTRVHQVRPHPWWKDGWFEAVNLCCLEMSLRFSEAVTYLEKLEQKEWAADRRANEASMAGENYFL